MDELRRDPVMAGLIEEHGPLELEPAADEFERLVVSIINQQMSTASATAIRERVFSRVEITPEGLLAADAAVLRDAGLSTQKVEYVRNVARAFRERDLSAARFADEPDEVVIDELTDIRGVGPWTANMYLMFALGRPDVLPLGDLAVRRGIEALYNDGASLTRAEMREIAAAWRPYRSLATLYIWAAYEAPDSSV
ncbi:DNA-3-methyladenine glycosylase family protein [Natronobiforma cellulositropha]|uniref:DNA-3-methyladenine glycosylase family protein n=1 Tax=Natronobiforma cellulositropha TaxID=1679076 RepID=UPI0021D5B9BC|nr:DNA-3-methyladenine glycosylase 2 family protein [Natronobiforma cellulositropha]